MKNSKTQGYYLEDLEVGMSAETSMIVSAEKIDTFAELSGDFNPIHMDEEFAATTMFGKRIAHGALSASLISAVLGNQLPGPGAIFVELNMRFRRPAFIDDEVIAKAEVAEINEKTGRVRMKVGCYVKGKPILRGDAGVVIKKRPKAED
ncbi:MAG: MaoC family dehydratase [Acidimicrobiales bacterium]|nr:MaoC family dehydratase [Hyphomonadaceae bacterium]RZV43025.1 MAG: MaoC family dehydratase [Acidimicrobiales bacterium]